MAFTSSKYVLCVLLIFRFWTGPVFGGEIHDAVQTGDLAKVEALLKNNPNLVFSKDSNPNGYMRDTHLGRDWTPLHVAAAYGHFDVAKLLVANKADFNARDRAGWTPLMWAAIGGYKEIVELLVANGADVNATNNDGRTPLTCTASMDHTNIAVFLLTHKADVRIGNSLQIAALDGNKNMVKLLLANGANANSRDEFGETPLHEAAYAYQGLVHLGQDNPRVHTALDIIKLLVANHAEVNATNNTLGQTPMAIIAPGTEAAKYLQQHGGHRQAVRRWPFD